jgi:hypothetical protein
MQRLPRGLELTGSSFAQRPLDNRERRSLCAVSDGRITFTANDASLRLAIPYSVGSSIILDASTLSSGVSLLSAAGRRHFIIEQNGNLTINKVSSLSTWYLIRHQCRSVRATCVLQVTLRNGMIRNTGSGDNGGSVQVTNGVLLAVSSRFVNNSVVCRGAGGSCGGGAIYATGSAASVTLRSSTLASNTVQSAYTSRGGAIYATGVGRGGVTLSQCTFSSNGAVTTGASALVARGGAVAVTGSGLSIAACTFKGNQARVTSTNPLLAHAQGGAVRVRNVTAFSVQGSSFVDNKAHAEARNWNWPVIASGGAMAVLSSANTTIASTTFTGNQAQQLGSAATAAAMGGGLYVNGSDSSVVFLRRFRGAVFSSNFAGSQRAAYGGGLAVGSGVGLISTTGLILTSNMANVTRNATDKRAAVSRGGGLHFAGRQLVLRNVSATANQALCPGRGLAASGAAGGAISVWCTTASSIVNGTFVRNQVLSSPAVVSGDDKMSSALGGAIAVLAGAANVTISGSTFLRNLAGFTDPLPQITFSFHRAAGGESVRAGWMSFTTRAEKGGLADPRRSCPSVECGPRHQLLPLHLERRQLELRRGRRGHLQRVPGPEPASLLPLHQQPGHRLNEECHRGRRQRSVHILCPADVIMHALLQRRPESGQYRGRPRSSLLLRDARDSRQLSTGQQRCLHYHGKLACVELWGSHEVDAPLGSLQGSSYGGVYGGAGSSLSISTCSFSGTSRAVREIVKEYCKRPAPLTPLRLQDVYLTLPSYLSCGFTSGATVHPLSTGATCSEGAASGVLYTSTPTQAVRGCRL